MRTIVTSALGLSIAAPLALAALSSPSGSPVPAVPDTSAAPAPMLFYWRASLVPENADRASALLARMNAYVQMNRPTVTLRVQTNAPEDHDTVHWFVEHESLNARKQYEREVDAEEAWTALLKEIPEAFDNESELITYLFHVAGPATDDRTKPLRHIRVTRSPASRVAAARALAVRVTEHLEATYEGVDARVYSSDVHDSQALYWFVDYETTSSWDAVRTALLRDARYVELLEEGEDLFLDEERTDLVMDY